LLITAIDTDPLAPNPETVISAHEKHFERGLQALSVVIDGPIYLCQSPDANIPGGAKRIQRVQFNGPHPAGLPGHHIHALSPIGFAGNEVWHIGYQDVIALGHLLARGKIWLQRVVSLAGAAVLKPRVLTVTLAAACDELLSGELQAGAARIISGSALSGYTASGVEAFLGQRQRQITVLPEMDAILGGEAGPLIPVADLQKLSPGGVLAVPLMRALLIGDIERARDLGALELVEEDLALITYACPSKNNYGQLLRDVLDQLHTEMI
jgi:Na+-transporting NADH:ubiquinone oxidoreductase subunit A